MLALALEEEFWSQVWRCEHAWPCQQCCWPWRRALEKAKEHGLVPGYGHYYIPELKRIFPAHRFAFAIGKHALLLPFGHTLHLCHRCDFAPCCNDVHLFLGTPAENVRDAASKGWFRGTRALIVLPDGTRMAPNLPLPMRSSLRRMKRQRHPAAVAGAGEG